MPAPEWTISPVGLINNGIKLAGCHIFQNATNYTFTTPNGNGLAASSGTTLPVTFTFNYMGDNWVITLLTAVVGANATGTWMTSTPESGDFIAHAGPSVGIEEEEAASSAHT